MTVTATSMMQSLAILVLLLSSTTIVLSDTTATSEQCTENDSKTCQQKDQPATASDTSTTYSSAVPPDCSVVMAPSSVDSDENVGYGLYSLQDRPRGAPVLFGDIVIPLPDVLNAQGMEFFARHYWFSSNETGGRDEGKNVVHSIVPGVGMLVNASPNRKKSVNVLPHRPSQDDGDCPRESCPMAGSFSHYSNYTWFVSSNITAGDELIMHRPDKRWWDERGLYEEYEEGNSDDDDIATTRPKQSIDWLRQYGMCVDNLMAKALSTLHSAGRGAYATRPLPKGSMVAPVPVVPIFEYETSLNLVKVIKKKTKERKQVIEQQKQLLLNYCFGHADSSILLYPYSPMVNLINHHPDKSKVNVKLQWSSKSSTASPQHPDWLRMNVDDLEDVVDETGGLLMELVALRDIAPGEEVFLDYGPEWRAAFAAHSWPAPADPESRYTPAHVMDEVATKLRTEEEQVGFPYASNVGTACFYDYQEEEGTASSSDNGVTTIPWNFTRHVFDWTNIRPCSILKRHDTTSGSFLYTVRIRNRAPAPPVPKMHLVSRVPRQAIRFYNLPYTTDAHLPQAFRHWIGLGDGVFPEAWLDEKGTTDED